MIVQVSKEEWVLWRNSKVTQEFFHRVTTNRETIKEGIADGQAETEKELYITIGRCQGMKDVLLYGLRDFDVIDTDSPNEGDTNNA